MTKPIPPDVVAHADQCCAFASEFLDELLARIALMPPGSVTMLRISASIKAALDEEPDRFVADTLLCDTLAVAAQRLANK